jgi:hypothetical protein
MVLVDGSGSQIQEKNLFLVVLKTGNKSIYYYFKIFLLPEPLFLENPHK